MTPEQKIATARCTQACQQCAYMASAARIGMELRHLAAHILHAHPVPAQDVAYLVALEEKA